MVNVDESRSVITGSSVHNQRIERHNRAANEQLIAQFKEIFYQLEGEGFLDPSNEIDLFCLHYVFLPLVNKSLGEFVSAHNSHKVSTENNQTPKQMFWGNQHLTQMYTGDHRSTYQGLDVNTLMETDLPHVVVPDTELPLDDAVLAELQNTINPLSETVSEAMEIYKRTVHFVGQRLLIKDQ